MLITLIMNVVLRLVSIIVVLSRFFHSIVDHGFPVVCYSRYEREETFMALNLGVTSCQSLEISLDQFVRGEVLEGSNAYYCEKCKEKVLHLPFLKNRFNLLFIFYVLRKISFNLLLLFPLDCVLTSVHTDEKTLYKSMTSVLITLMFYHLHGNNWVLLLFREQQ